MFLRYITTDTICFNHLLASLWFLSVITSPSLMPKYSPNTYNVQISLKHATM